MAVIVVLSAIAPSGFRQAAAEDRPPFNVALNLALLSSLDEPLLDPMEDPPSTFKKVKARDFDPAHTELVEAAWLDAIGCPTGAPVAIYPATSPTGTYTDPGCATGDAKDKHNAGLLLSKSSPTGNNAAAVAELTNVKGMTLMEIGYDIRKHDGYASMLGSHCGAGAPRFNIVTSADTYFVGCSSPPANVFSFGMEGWTRLRWGAGGTVMGFSATTFTLVPITGTLKRIVIVFDEGYDTGPDFFGAAILDNIAVNGTVVGRGKDD